MPKGTVWVARGSGWVGRGGLGLREHPGLRRRPGLKRPPGPEAAARPARTAESRAKQGQSARLCRRGPHLATAPEAAEPRILER